MPRPYDHFRRDATDFVRQNRTDWTASQAQNTISTIWAAVTAVRTHYAGSQDQDQSPGLPAPNHIPVRPYTKREAGRARKTGQLPPRLQGAQLIGQPQGGQPRGPQPPGGQEQPPQGPSVQKFPAQQPHVLQPPVDPQLAQPAGGQLVANSHPDRVPYPHWPQLPWNTIEHDLRVPQSSTVRPEAHEQEAWLAGRPYGPEEEDNGMWQGKKHLGGGSYGIVGLWVRTDAANNIEQRMVIKDTTPTTLNWRDPHNWRDRIPKEVRIHQLVEERRRQDPETCRHLIRYLGYRLHMTQRRYRLYLEFCSHGTLSDAIWKHSKYWVDKEGALKDPNKEAIPQTTPVPEKPDPEVIPEAFIWGIIKALASACLLLQTGTNTDPPGIDGWKPITHLDIQNPNIFLQFCVDEPNADPPDSGQGEAEINSQKRKRNESVSLKGKELATSAARAKKPRKASITTALIPILGDFGLSALSPDATDEGCPINDNPDNYVWDSYHPRYAPEHQFQFKPKRLGQKTDVWGIGNIAWQLVTNRRSAFGPAREDQMKEALPKVKYHGYIPIASWYDQAINIEQDASETLLLGRYFPASARYSEELKQLVRHCLDWETEDRPDLKAVHDQAKRVLENDPEADAILSDINRLGLSISNEDEFRIGQPAPERHIEQ